MLTHGSYEQLKDFVKIISKEHALVRVIEVYITRRNNEPEVHKILLILQWPYGFPEVMEDLASNVSEKELEKISHSRKDLNNLLNDSMSK